jgi:hypothetical protein
MPKGQQSLHVAKEGGANKAPDDVLAARDTRARMDDRNAAQRHLGDPPFHRSALAQRQRAEALPKV